MFPRIIFLLVFVGCLMPASFRAQTGYTLTLEEHATDVVPGLTTYRMYIDMVNTDDFLASIYGGDTAPLLISTSDGFYNDAFGAADASGINPAFIAFFPTIAADSWITIGIDSQNTGDEVPISTVEDPSQPFVECFAAGSALDGQNVVIDSPVGGVWYLLIGAPNGLPDENMRVLFLQMTTAGEICGTINAQVFLNGMGGYAQSLFTYEFCGTGTYSPVIAGGGCMDEGACNYDADATEDDGSCVFAGTYYDCAGNCLFDADSDGICDELEISGCTDSFACNYDEFATADDGSCAFESLIIDITPDNYASEISWDLVDDMGAVIASGNFNGTELCLNEACFTFTMYDSFGDGICCSYGQGSYSVSDQNGTVVASGGDYGSSESTSFCLPAVPGCTDELACNFAPLAQEDDGSCTYPETCFDCTGVCLDENATGICDCDEVYGCTDSEACNFQPAANVDDGSCAPWVYVTGGCYSECPTCLGALLNDADGDGVCDSAEVGACTDAEACNYDECATDDDGSCDYSCIGCMDQAAANYDPTATQENEGSCVYCEAGTYVAIVEMYDLGGDGWNGANYYMDSFDGATSISGNWDEADTYIADAGIDFHCIPLGCYIFTSGGGSADNEIAVILTDQFGTVYADGLAANIDWNVDFGLFQVCGFEGCTDDEACNYNISAAVDDGSCWLPNDDGSCPEVNPYYDSAGNCLNDFDGDGVCNELEVPGCTFEVACNFNPGATEDDGSCFFYCPGCTDEAACNYDASAIQEDGSCEYPVDWYGVDYVDCDNVCLNDNDGDGVCDEDEIPGCTDPVACNFFAEATDQLIPCDYPDEGYDCEGNCLNDTDEDGLCDPFDACPLDAENDADGDGVCGNDEVDGCTNNAACNYDPMATDDDGTCETIEMLCGAAYFNCDCTCQSDADFDGVCDEAEVPGCQESSACNFNAEATDSDGSCEWSSCAGCIYVYACNYDPSAIYSDGSCEFGTCPGCTDPTACNFNPTVSEDDGSCTVNDACGECGGSGPVEGYNCDGSCIDSDEDEVCDFDEAGCTDNTACNFAPLAQEDDGSCTYPETCFDCTGVCLDENANGICDCDEVYGCTDSEACNFQPAANVDDGSCAPWVYVSGGCYDECPTCLGELLNDADGDGVCDSAEVGACTDAEACNYDECATDDDGSCFYPEWGYDCEGNCTADVDGDCVCDPEEIYGCTYAGACNFNPEATEEDGSCIVAETFYDCDGNCLEDQDADGVCDELEVLGCNDPTACNFQSSATEDDDSCWYPADDYLGCDGLCINDADGDGVCDEVEVAGCQDCTACNFNSDATDEDGSCLYPEEGLDCEGNCLLDADGNGTCDDAELALLISFLNSGELCGPGTFWDQATGQCTTADQCPMDFDGNGEIGSGDLLLFLAQYGLVCE